LFLILFGRSFDAPSSSFLFRGLRCLFAVALFFFPPWKTRCGPLHVFNRFLSVRGFSEHFEDRDRIFLFFLKAREIFLLK